jgi:hypothetical protein
MRNLICGFLLAGLMAFTATIPALAADDGAPAGAPERILFKRAAVASFLVGRGQPEMDESMDLTLSCPIGQICKDDPTILPQAGITLTRLVDQQLRGRFNRQVAPRSEVQNAEVELVLNNQQDTPRDMAKKLGHILKVDVAVIGTVWRYRERGAVDGIPDSPSTVAFAVYFIEVESGRMLWRGLFEGTQQTLSDNLLQAREQLKLGLKWLTADELAEHGVREVFQKFPPNILPGDFTGEIQTSDPQK